MILMLGYPMRGLVVIKQYKVNKRNSTVCGYPGRETDWTKFDWDGKAEHIDIKGQRDKAPLPWVDDGFIAPNCQYLHVPWDWSEQGTIFRVRPNESMQAGSTWRGHKVIRQTAIKKPDGWYWQLELGLSHEGVK